MMDVMEGVFEERSIRNINNKTMEYRLLLYFTKTTRL